MDKGDNTADLGRTCSGPMGGGRSGGRVLFWLGKGDFLPGPRLVRQPEGLAAIQVVVMTRALQSPIYTCFFTAKDPPYGLGDNQAPETPMKACRVPGYTATADTRPMRCLGSDQNQQLKYNRNSGTRRHHFPQPLRSNPHCVKGTAGGWTLERTIGRIGCLPAQGIGKTPTWKLKIVENSIIINSSHHEN